jgi:hypothetical protein
MGKSKEEEKKDRTALLLQERKKIIYNLLLVGTASVVVLIGILTMAWFTINKNVNGSSARITIDDLPFELKVQGYYGYSDDWLSSEYYRIANTYSAAPQPTADPAQTLSTSGHGSIQWLMTQNYNAKNYVTSSTKDEDIGIRPGSSGELKFWVASKGSASVDISFKLHLTPYVVEYEKENGEYKLDANGKLIEDRIISVEEDDDYDAIVDYLKSHVMFFKKCENGKYSGLITLDQEFSLVYNSTEQRYVDELTFETENGIYQDAPFSIYWVWPETLAEAVLPQSMQKNGAQAISPDNNTEVLDKLVSSPGKFLKGFTANDVESQSITQNIIYRYYKKLGVEYNEADQEIGDNIGYLLLELSASGL